MRKRHPYERYVTQDRLSDRFVEYNRIKIHYIYIYIYIYIIRTYKSFAKISPNSILWLVIEADKTYSILHLHNLICYDWSRIYYAL